MADLRGELDQPRLRGREAGLDRLVAGVGELRSRRRPRQVGHGADDPGRPERDQRGDHEPAGGERDAADPVLHRPAS